MTASLSMRLLAGGSGDIEQLPGIVVANVYDAATGMMVVPAVALPVGDQAAGRVQVEPGTYMVEAILPSGVRIRRNVTVGSDRDHLIVFTAPTVEPASISADPAGRRRDLRRLGRLGPDVDRSTTARAPESPRRPPEVPARLHAIPAGARWLPTVARIPNVDVRWIEHPRPECWTFSALDELIANDDGRASGAGDLTRRLSAGATMTLNKPPESVSGHRRRWTYSFLNGEPLGSIDLPPSPDAGTARRRFLLIHDERHVRLAVLPFPWLDEDVPDVRVTVDVRDDSALRDPRMSSVPRPDTPFRVSVHVDSPEAAAALRYIASSSFVTAANFVRVSGILDAELDRPLRTMLSATAAYTVLGADPSNDELSRLIARLSELTWLPDGAILRAALLLSAARDKVQLEEARSSLLEGYARGLPVFTRGLLWLLDGLSSFDDDECVHKFAEVRRVASHADPNQNFVVLGMRR
jgi:hypothetical protein